MQNAGWIKLLKRIPVEQHSKLVLITSNNVEINVQGILRLEADYAVIRGRLAASTEAGRFFFVPYDQLNHLAFREGVLEAQIQELFGQAPPSAARREEVEGPETTPLGPSGEEGEPAHPLPGPERASLPGKAALLERLRRTRPGQALPPRPAQP
ncbi:MAG: hypothetical protein JO112_17450 [Planctomycetes bacterium]|nr:hypothetical protein [Planctomycetota bacterium]